MTTIALVVLCALFFAPAPQTDASRAPRIERNISYVERGTADQMLDLYLPQGNGFPTVVFIHGGSLRESAERRSSPMYAGVCPQLAARNIACATIDYRLSPTFRWPAMPDDAAAAVKWVKDNIAQRGGDPRRIFIFGHSSGCGLAAILATNGAYLAKVGLTTADVAGIVPMGCTLEPTVEVTARFPGDELKTRWTTLKSGEGIRFKSGAVELAVTLAIPGGSPRGARRPAVVLLGGSGAAPRSAVQPYADHHVRLGLATFAFDKRGSGESSGDWTAASLEDLVDDAAAALRVSPRGRKSIRNGLEYGE